MTLKRHPADDLLVVADASLLHLQLQHAAALGLQTIFVDTESSNGRCFLLDQQTLSALLDDINAPTKTMDIVRAATPLRVLRHGQVAAPDSIELDNSGRIVGLWIDRSHGRDQPSLVFQELQLSQLRARAAVVGLPSLQTWRNLAAQPHVFGRLEDRQLWSRPDPALQAPSEAPPLVGIPRMLLPKILKKKPGTVFLVKLSIGSSSTGGHEDRTDVSVDIPREQSEATLEVELMTSPPFEVQGAAHKPIVMRRHGEEQVVTFRVRVTDRVPNRPAGLLAIFNHQGRSCGHVSRAFDWSEDRATATEIPGSAAAGAGLPIHDDAEQPDLTVYIAAPGGNDGQHFTCVVKSPFLDPTAPQTFDFPQRSSQYVGASLRQIVISTLTADERRARLREVGRQFWDAAPENFKTAFWQLVDSGRPPRSIFVISQWPYLPWELMIPNRNIGAYQEKEPLGVSSAVGRWTRPDVICPPQQLRVSQAAVIAPQYSGDDRLPEAQLEADFVCSRLHGQRVHPATLEAIDDHLGHQEVSLVHFVGHGHKMSDDDLDDDEAIVLENGVELRCSHLRSMPGVSRLMRRRGPVVFLNACEVGSEAFTLGGGAGFPTTLSLMGARAIIAPLWSVEDSVASQMVTSFYEECLDGEGRTVAEVLQTIRARAYAPGGPDTLAAYVFHGDPLATLTLDPV